MIAFLSKANCTHRHVFLLIWPWPWPDDLDIRTWPRYSKMYLHAKM